MSGSSLVHDKQYTKSGRRDIGQLLEIKLNLAEALLLQLVLVELEQIRRCERIKAALQ